MTQKRSIELSLNGRLSGASDISSETEPWLKKENYTKVYPERVVFVLFIYTDLRSQI